MKSLASAYVNLLKTSIGSGVLNFPFLFKTYGGVLTIIITIVTGCFAANSLNLLILCSQPIGRGANLGSLANHSIPYARTLVDVAVFMKCFGVATSYVIIAGHLLPSLINTFLDVRLMAMKPVCLALFILVIAPFCYLKKMDKLKYTSMLGVIAIFFVILASLYRYSHDGMNPESNYSYFATSPSVYWMAGFGKFVFSFTCHQNIFYIHSEMEDNSLHRMKRLIGMTAFSAFVLYMSFGISNYMLYGSQVRDNVLMNYPEDLLTSIVHLLYVVVMGVSYPLQLAPGKTYLMNIIGRIVGEKKRESDLLNNCVITILILGTYFLAVSGIGLGLVYALVGATASTFMCLILPAIYYLHAEIEKTMVQTVMSYVSFLFGIFVFMTTIISLALRIPVH